MGKEAFIRGKHDSHHHDGRASNLRREQEAADQLHTALQGLFKDMNEGVTLTQAVQFAGMDNPLGEHWRKRIAAFNELFTKPAQDGDIEILDTRT